MTTFVVDSLMNTKEAKRFEFRDKDVVAITEAHATWQNMLQKTLWQVDLLRCEIQISYVIGVAKPIFVMVDTCGTGIEGLNYEEIICGNLNLTPYGVIETLGLRDVKYKQTAKYGHFGTEDLPWEETDKVEDLKKYI